MKNKFAKQGFGCSHIGLIRVVNEDCFLVDNENGVYAVADGMGGLPYGEVASQFSIEIITQLINDTVAGSDLSMEDWFEAVQHFVSEKGRKIAPRSGIGTTLTVLRILANKQIQIGHCGDSAAYVIDSESIERITPSHSSNKPTVQVRNPNAANGATSQASKMPFEVLENYIGHPHPPASFFQSLSIPDGSRVFLCTDGIFRYLDEAEILAIHRAQPNLKSFCESLIHTVNLRGGFDNATVVAFDQ